MLNTARWIDQYLGLQTSNSTSCIEMYLGIHTTSSTSLFNNTYVINPKSVLSQTILGTTQNVPGASNNRNKLRQLSCANLKDRAEKSGIGEARDDGKTNIIRSRGGPREIMLNGSIRRWC